eukprot:2941811-Alexandrium_andersonii.AAC.1
MVTRRCPHPHRSRNRGPRQPLPRRALPLRVGRGRTDVRGSGRTHVQLGRLHMQVGPRRTCAKR